MGGDLIRAGQFGLSHYLGWNPNEPDWRSRLARDVSLGEKSNQEILFEYEKENLARGACLIGGKLAGELLGKAFRWLRMHLFSRTINEIIKDAINNSSKWRVIRSEKIPSNNMRNKGGTSLQELLQNNETGEEIVRHTIFKPDGTIFEKPHFRPFWK
jgi:hypothetical protein